MKGRLFNLAAAVSLVLCVATVALWVRSYFAGDSVGVERYAVDLADTRRVEHTASGIATGGGRLAFGTLSSDAIVGPSVRRYSSRCFWGWNSGGLRRSRFTGFNPGPSGGETFLGFDLRTGASGWQLLVPFWFLASAFAAMPLSLGVRALSARCRTRSGEALCPRCGYDLRATPGRCPECGTAITTGAVG